jgi:hypothetical protein
MTFFHVALTWNTTLCSLVEYIGWKRRPSNGTLLITAGEVGCMSRPMLSKDISEPRSESAATDVGEEVVGDGFESVSISSRMVN